MILLATKYEHEWAEILSITCSRGVSIRALICHGQWECGHLNMQHLTQAALSKPAVPAVPADSFPGPDCRPKDKIQTEFADGPNRPPFEFLYDLESDPDQLVNVVMLTAEQKTE